MLTLFRMHHYVHPTLSLSQTHCRSLLSRPNAKCKHTLPYPTITLQFIKVLIRRSLVVLLAVEDTEDGEEEVEDIEIERDASLRKVVSK